MSVEIGIVLMLAGVGGVMWAARRSHEAARRLDFIRSLGNEADANSVEAVVSERVQTPLVNRMFSPAAKQIRHTLSRLYPSRDIDRVHADLLKAGLTGTVRAEEFVALQVSSVLIGLAIGVTSLATGFGGSKLGLAL